MRWIYACPECSAMLNPKESVVLTAAHEGRRVLIGFHPEPGNYTLYLPPGVEIADGDRWDFFCPVCRASLTLPENDRFCTLEIRVEEERRKLVFSRVAGEHATFIFAGHGLEAEYGEHTDPYLPQWRKLGLMR